LIARIGGEESGFSVYFDSGDSVCEHCYNGVQDVDEVGVDCGGSCGVCSGEYSAVRVSGFWERFWVFLNR